MTSLLTLDIIPGYTRPVITIKDGTTCLFDMGADTPVWTQGAERLKYTFGAEKVDGKYFLLSGFGKEPEIADVYVAHDIALQGIGKDGMDDEIIFRNLVVACTSRPTMVADLILPATALDHMNFIFRNLDVQYPVVEVEHKKEEYFVNPIYSSVDDRLVERAYSFFSE